MKRKLAIVGFSDTSRDLAPFDDEETDIWGCNHIYQFIPRWDALFEMHNPTELEAKYAERWPAYREFLSIPHGKPIYMQEAYFESAVQLPIVELRSTFHFLRENTETKERQEEATFKSTISYMLAMGLLKDYEEISLFGVDMTIDSEWSYQRHNLAFFMGWARGCGVEIVLPDKSMLMKEGQLTLYGYEHAVDRYAPAIQACRERVGKYDEKLAEMRVENERMADAVERLIGARVELQTLAKSGAFNGQTDILYSRIEEAGKAIEEEKVKVREHLYSLHYLDGKRDAENAIMVRMGVHNRGELV